MKDRNVIFMLQVDPLIALLKKEGASGNQEDDGVPVWIC
jgi:hypothetical protein